MRKSIFAQVSDGLRFKENALSAVSSDSAIEYSTSSAPFLRALESQKNIF
jgi:hypothetical protein